MGLSYFNRSNIEVEFWKKFKSYGTNQSYKFTKVLLKQVYW